MLVLAALLELHLMPMHLMAEHLEFKGVDEMYFRLHTKVAWN